MSELISCAVSASSTSAGLSGSCVTSPHVVASRESSCKSDLRTCSRELLLFWVISCPVEKTPEVSAVMKLSAIFSSQSIARRWSRTCPSHVRASRCRATQSPSGARYLRTLYPGGVVAHSESRSYRSFAGFSGMASFCPTEGGVTS